MDTLKEGNNKLMSFCTDDEKLLEKYKAIWTKIEDLKNIKLNALPVFDDRYIKIKIRTLGDKEHFYTKLRGLNVPEGDIGANFLLPFLLILYMYTTRTIIYKYI